MVALLGFAAIAQAISISGPVARPASTQSGAHSSFHIHVDVGPGDDLHDLAIDLPPGQALYPQTQPTCTETQFTSDACPSESQVGTPTVSGAGLQVGGGIYNLVPGSGESGRLGMVLRTPLGKIFEPIPITQSADTGLTMTLANIPNSVAGSHVHVDSVDLVLNEAFVSNPTSCSTATTGFTAAGYSDPSTKVTAQDSYTPIGCAPPPPPPKCKVPNVVHRKLADAKAAIRSAKCAVGTVTRRESTRANLGRVIRQSPAAGKQLAVGTKINLVVGK